MTLTLREITKSNWLTAARLKLTEEQKKFIAPNWYSMLQALHSDGALYDRGIYLGDEMIGYALMGQDLDDKQHYIDRFMIALDYQGKGYGRAALQLVIDEMKARYNNPDAIFITFEPDNTIARSLYESMGFADTGQTVDGELLFRLTLTKSNP